MTTEAEVGKKVRAGVIIQLGLLGLTVDLHSAVIEEEHYNNVCTNGHPETAVRQHLRCPTCDNDGRDVKFRKAKQIGKGSYLVVPEDVLQQAQQVGLEHFKELTLKVYRADQCDLQPNGKAYYLSSPRQGDSYAMLREIVRNHPDLMFVGQFTMREGSAPGLYTLVANNGTLVLRQMARPDMLRGRPATDGSVNNDLLEAADRYVTSSIEEYDPTEYRNKRRDLIEKAVAGIVPTQQSKSDDSNVLDLIGKLNQAVADKVPAGPAKRAVKRTAGTTETKVSQPRKTAAKKTATKKTATKAAARKVG